MGFSAIQMAAVLSFDSLKLADKLIGAGVPDAQARAIVDVVRESREISLAEQSKVAQDASERAVAELDTKTERAILKLDTKTERAVLKLEGEIALVRKDMVALENKLTLRLGAMLVVAVGVILAVLPLLIAR